MEEENKTVSVEEIRETLLDTMKHYGAGEISIKTEFEDHYLVVSVRSKDFNKGEDEP